MNSFDIVLLVLLAGLVVLGVRKGLARLVIGVGALFAAFLIAAQLHQTLSPRLGFLQLSEPATRLVAYITLFAGTLIAGAVLGYLAGKLLKVAMLGWVDRLAGAALGLVATLLLAALIVLPAVAYTKAGQEALRGSRLAPYVTAVADLATRVVPDDLSRRYREGMEHLRSTWRDKTDATPGARKLDGPAAG